MRCGTKLDLFRSSIARPPISFHRSRSAAFIDRTIQVCFPSTKSLSPWLLFRFAPLDRVLLLRVETNHGTFLTRALFWKRDAGSSFPELLGGTHPVDIPWRCLVAFGKERAHELAARHRALHGCESKRGCNFTSQGKIDLDIARGKISTTLLPLTSFGSSFCDFRCRIFFLLPTLFSNVRAAVIQCSRRLNTAVSFEGSILRGRS
jgi:hypothetical protein